MLHGLCGVSGQRALKLAALMVTPTGAGLASVTGHMAALHAIRIHRWRGPCHAIPISFALVMSHSLEI